MKILFVLENYLPHIGGVEIVFKNLCEGLAAKGHRVTVVTHRMPGTKARERMAGVEVIRIRCMDSRYLFTFAAVPEVIRCAKNSDIIHTTTYNGAFPAWIGAIVRRKPKIITVHETWLGRWREFSNFSAPVTWAHELLEWLVYHIPRFDRYVCVSESTKNMLSEALPSRSERIVRIHNGFDAPPKASQQEVQKLRESLGVKGKFAIFAYGRPGTSKGFEYLVQAYPLIKKRIPDAKLLLMLSKDTQYRHKVEEFKRSSPDIVFLDPQPYAKLAAYRALADCIVVPSITEGFGYAAIEAASSGTPVVTTDTTSIPEVIYGKHILVKPKSAKAIADGVVKVKRGEYKTAPAKRFPWSETVWEYEKLYEKLEGRK
jgi:glycosyltransferase involved in cell wall biosynthesis